MCYANVNPTIIFYIIVGSAFHDVITGLFHSKTYRTHFEDKKRKILSENKTNYFIQTGVQVIM